MRNERISAASNHAIEVYGVDGPSTKPNLKAIAERTKSTDMMNASGEAETKTTTETKPESVKTQEKKDNTILYVGIGIVALIGIYYMVSKK
jgi:sorbitol-specific phosphotransferase system component IIBC